MGVVSGDLALQPELLEAPRPCTAGVVADQLPALAAEPVEHRARVALLPLHGAAGHLHAHPGLLALRVVRGDDRGVLPGGHPSTVTGGFSEVGPRDTSRSSGASASAKRWWPRSSGWIVSDHSPGSCGSSQPAAAGSTKGRPASVAARDTSRLIQSIMESAVPGL